jgi:hypothetical protein
MSSQALCKACLLLEGLNSGLPHIGVSRTKRGQQHRHKAPIHVKLEEHPHQQQPQQQPQQQQQQRLSVDEQQR